MIALIVVNLVWTGVALYINYSWKSYINNMHNEYQKQLVHDCGKALQIGVKLGKKGDVE